MYCLDVRLVQVYDYVDPCIPMLARMYERRLKGYNAIGYVIERPPSPSIPDGRGPVNQTNQAILSFVRSFLLF